MAITFDTKKLLAALRVLREALPTDIDKAGAPEPGVRSTPKLLLELRSASKLLDSLVQMLDPVKPPEAMIELFAPRTIGRLIGGELLQAKAIPLESIVPFYGSGVYALYYTGDHTAYRAISRTDCPIYVGAADPRDRKAKSPQEQGKGLYARLSKHKENISRAKKSLRLCDFSCRYLVTESGWQGTVEEFLISLYRPIWNKETRICSGFGKHGDITRKELSAWDVLHAGRGWTTDQKSRSGKTPEAVTEAIEKHFLRLCKAEPDRWRTLLSQDWVKARFKR
jgi:hypothetical protein